MPYNILLVDDDREFREEMADYLEEYRVIEAADGRQALEILQKPNDIDLVLLDVVMPGLRGTEVLKRIKQMAPGLAVVILTGYSSKDVAIDALKADADDYIEKPADIGKAKEIIERLLRQTRAKGDIVTGGIDGKIERVKHFLEINYHKQPTLRDAAAAVGLSPKYLSRVFKERVGTGFNSFRLRTKTDKAKQMLLDTQANVEQVSAALGYENPESFIRMFKAITRKTPAAFRRIRKKGRSR
ncbi:MAG TPA: response regulator [bacterium]|nr:response regulator [bacterium]